MIFLNKKEVMRNTGETYSSMNMSADNSGVFSKTWIKKR